MNTLSKLYRGETTYDFVAIARTTLKGSTVAIVISLVALAALRFNLSIDFTGGTIVEAENASGVTIEEVRDALATVGREGARVQFTGSGTISVQTEALDVASQDALVAAIADIAGIPIDDTNVSAVGPTFGDEVTRRAIQALVIFLVVVSLFMAWRFEWKMAMAGLAALFHDLIITAGVYAIVGLPVTPATIIAILTILGYSLYDTVVVFDKVGENAHNLHGKATYVEIVNLSMNQVLMRSVNTSLTALLPVGSLLFVGSLLLGAATLQEVALALFIGIAVGTYSSIFVAVPLVAFWKEREPEWQRAQRRAERRRSDDTIPAGVVADVTEPAVVHPGDGALARPPRQRRKRR